MPLRNTRMDGLLLLYMLRGQGTMCYLNHLADILLQGTVLHQVKRVILFSQATHVPSLRSMPLYEGMRTQLFNEVADALLLQSTAPCAGKRWPFLSEATDILLHQGILLQDHLDLWKHALVVRVSML